MKKLNYAIYARVSTGDQSSDQQVAELEKILANMPDVGEVTVYRDTISGAKTTRAGLDEMMKAVRKGHIHVVCASKLDRLGRSLVHLAQMLGEFESRGVAVFIPSQGIDTRDSNPAGKLVLGILSAIAEFERSIISERTKLRLQHIKAQGKPLGRPSRMAKLIVAYQAALQHRKVAKMTVRDAAEALGCSVGTATKVIKEYESMLAALKA
jgi:DNA invertase Pin-like site-specific DNA recombinase